MVPTRRVLQAQVGKRCPSLCLCKALTPRQGARCPTFERVKLFIIICIFCAYTWTISGERLQDHWSSGLSIVLLRFISVIIQVSFGTQAPHILSAVVIRVGVNVAIKTELFYIVLTLQKHALHQYD